ncbi:MAG: IS200/IS605 family transposase [Ignavibacteria bacterium]|jgi:REP element-mobilizing transposase RayT|nr:IS200/IS605 family transposase [Ignavibacteria bacterium]MDH7528376.1 IS200/IS605 family transposase [Ignavibacteria bacterium]
MPYTRVLIHLIWATKNREKLITKDKKQLLLNHIKENAKKKGIFIDTINCVEDHIHILISLGRDQTISKVVQLIKGESSHWWNSNSISKYKFEWQDEYMALSVSHSAIQKVRNYIKNQEEHHRVKNYLHEHNLFLKKYEFEK